MCALTSLPTTPHTAKERERARSSLSPTTDCQDKNPTTTRNMPSKPKKGKEKESKKAAQKKKEKVIEDKTFGLKNKNKSKVVQAKIKSIERNVLNSGDPKIRRQEEQRKKAKADAKARKKAMEDERNALFGEALLAVQKKGKINKKNGKVEAKGRDADDDTKKSGTSRAMKM